MSYLFHGIISTRQVANRYRHEQWRFDKLRALKKKYDPEGKFDFFGNIVR